MYNNVIFNSDNFNLYTDRILIDMISGDIKLGVINDTEKVKFIKKWMDWLKNLELNLSKKVDR